MAIASARPARRPVFRLVVLTISVFVAIEFLLAGAAVSQYGDHVRVFGWRADRVQDGARITEVDPHGPVAQLLTAGDVVVAFDDDPRIERLRLRDFLRFLPAGTSYTLTIARDGSQRAVTAEVGAARDAAQFRLAASLVFSALVWCVVATLIALFRPDQAMSRSAYMAGMALGLFLLAQAPAPTMVWLSPAWATALAFVFPFAPLHLAVGYHFYSRFPGGMAVPLLWRRLGLAFFALCGLLSLYGPLLTTGLLLAGRETYLSVYYALAPLDPWLLYANLLVFPLAGIAILAVLTRNYRALDSPDSRRRLRWVVLGTIIGLTPFLLTHLGQTAVVLFGVALPAAGWVIPSNLATTAIPISFFYAIVKHQIFDINVVVRRGMQYLLARNALRTLLLLPVAGLVYGLVVHRHEPLGQLLVTSSPYLYLIAAAVLGMRFRSKLADWLDRRFFREAYDRERILLGLIDDLDELQSASSVSKLVSRELEAAFHPQALFIWYREGDDPELRLAYSSGGYLHSADSTHRDH